MRRQRIGTLLSVLLALSFTSGCLGDAPRLPEGEDSVHFPVAGPTLSPVSITIDDYHNGVLSYHADCDATTEISASDLRRQARILSAVVFTAWQPVLDTSPKVTTLDRKPLVIPPTCTRPVSLGTGVLAAAPQGSDLRLSVGIEWTERGAASTTPPGRRIVTFVLARNGTLHRATIS